MASTNKTTHYELSQYIGSDKPTYMVDYNADMLNIDTGIYDAQNKANTNETSIGNLSNLNTTAKNDLVSAINENQGNITTNTNNIGTNTSNIATNTTNIGTLTNLTTTSKTDLVVATNEVNAKIGTLSNLETTIKSNVVNAINEIVEKFNLSNYKNNINVTATNVSGTAPTLTNNINSAYNNDGSIGKIYGSFTLAGNGSSSSVSFTNITIDDTGLRPSSDINILGICLQNISRPRAGVQSTSNWYQYETTEATFTLKTDGTIEMNNLPCWDDEARTYIFVASLIFATDFGDVPVPPQP